jgi:uncharacterized membrane protein YoaK (UPF0700 family)
LKKQTGERRRWAMHIPLFGIFFLGILFGGQYLQDTYHIDSMWGIVFTIGAIFAFAGSGGIAESIDEYFTLRARYKEMRN